MDESAASEACARLMPALSDALGIEHWRLRVKFNLRDDGASGECCPNPSYEHAFINLDPAAFDDHAELLRVFVHELIHVVVSPMRAYRDAYAVIPKGSAEDERENRLWRHFEEQTVLNVERAFRGLGGYDKFLSLAEGKVVAVKRVTPDPNVARVRKPAKPKAGKRGR